jgi:hypothetical protein
MDETVKAISNKPSARPNNSPAGPQVGVEGALPLIRLCKIFA